jgi:hypothetical protein
MKNFEDGNGGEERDKINSILMATGFKLRAFATNHTATP